MPDQSYHCHILKKEWGETEQIRKSTQNPDKKIINEKMK